jgi:hypothetical protein
MRVFLLILFLFASNSFCIPFASNNLDPSSNLSNLLLLVRILNRKTVPYLPTTLVAYTNSPAKTTVKPDDPNLQKCRTTSSLPDGVSLANNGDLTYSGTPTRTVNSISINIFCVDGSNQYTESNVDFEIRGYDWIKSLSATNFSSPGHDVALGSDSEINFLASTYNNGINLAADFGQSVIKNSSPTPGTSWSPLVVQLDSEGQLLRTRLLGGTLSQSDFKIAVDSQRNVYTMSNLAGAVPLTINADSEFGGAAVNKTPSQSVNGNFLLSQIRSDGSFGYAISVSATTTSEATAICYNPKTNSILANGWANGAAQDLGIDFGSSDPSGTALGFQLEFTPDKSYIRSRKFNGSTHRTNAIDCRSDGSYSLAIRQVSNSLDYRQSFDGQSDTKVAASANGGVGLTSIDSNGNYLFTKFFSHASTSTTPAGLARDSDGNYFILFTSTGSNYDLRVGVDGISDIKTFAGATNGSYLVKLNPNGSYAWGKMIRGSIGLGLNSLAIHPKRKSIFLLGSFSGTNIDFFSDFGTSVPLTSQISSEQNPMLIEINSESGSLTAARMLAQSSKSLRFESMKFDSLGNLYLTGNYAIGSNFQYGTDGGVTVKNHSYGTDIGQALFIKLRP